MNSLAIIIPCWRITYLEETLRSFSSQTCKKFTLYIGDDASPVDVESVVKKYSTALDIRYHRFADNLGGKNLVAQWARCVALSKNEPWIWVFSDDDIVDPGCVEAFYATVKDVGDKYDVFRFNSLVIDGKGHIIRICPPHPLVEHPMLFAYHRLMLMRQSFAPDHIFSRRSYEHFGGFVDLPAAWGSDDATWIEFAGESGIYTIESPFVRWRQSEANIGSVNAALSETKMQADIQFLRWLKLKFAHDRIEELELDVTVLMEISKNWLMIQFVSHSGGKLIWHLRRLAKELNDLYQDGIALNYMRLLKIDAKIILRTLSANRRKLEIENKL